MPLITVINEKLLENDLKCETLESTCRASVFGIPRVVAPARRKSRGASRAREETEADGRSTARLHPYFWSGWRPTRQPEASCGKNGNGQKRAPSEPSVDNAAGQRGGSSQSPTGPDAQEDARPSSPAVAAIQNVNLPPFWPSSPCILLLQVEAQFRPQQITSEQTRYWHLVSLPPDVAEDFADILASPHPSHPYNTLKEAIISRKSESEQSRPLIVATELGDHRPSTLMRRVRQFAGGTSATREKVWRESFFQRLPQSMVPVLVAADVPVDTLAEMADRVADYSWA
ncbi:hypothetical protein HPB50_026524 [Hyalomma asiaticum]|uniref:Uncharacterized protein n=1 Tax=Hyalomma asiaticum TaxID=266040 RepID=A0ACB7S341_HYAAI|nr:hypothetical protein HPB50_026524 [Hyalomma asiaticum]